MTNTIKDIVIEYRRKKKTQCPSISLADLMEEWKKKNEHTS